MTETSWESEGEEPRPKKGLPKWLWFCGGGCLLAVIAGVILMVMVGKYVTRQMDPEVQWERLEQAIAFDERPDVMIIGIPFMEMIPGLGGMWTLADENGNYSAVFMQFTGSDVEKTRRELFDPDSSFDFGGMMGNYGRHGIELGEMDIQGRKLQYMRHQTFPEGEVPKGEVKGSMAQAQITLEVTPEGASGLVVLVYSKIRSNDPVPLDEVVDFLRPFHIGPNR